MPLPTSLSVASSADANPYADFGASGFTSSPVYNKPALDFSNPLHLAFIAAAGALVFVYLKRKK